MAICLVAIAGLFSLHLYDKHQAVNKAEEATVLRINNENSKLSKELLRKSEIDTRNKDEQINKLYADLRIANKRLQQRPSRPALPPTIEVSCTGRELYREDGQFLRGEATAAEAIRVERDYYFNEYEKARKQFEQLKGNK